MNNKMNILLVTNKKYLHYTGLLLHSLLSLQDREVSIYLFHRDLQETDVQELQQLVCSYDACKICIRELTSEQIVGLKPTEKLPVEAYFRIVAIDLLPKEMDRILYLDVDIIVKKPLDDLYQTDFEGKAAVVCQDIYGYMYGASQESEQRLGLRQSGSYFNSGVMLLNLTVFREQQLAKKTLDYIYEKQDVLKWEDQDALNAVLDGMVKFVPWHLFDCVPALMVCRQQDIAAGIVRPVYQDEIAEVNAHPEQFFDMTQAIYDAAYLIHYLGETKPDRENRASAGCYEIFDQAFWDAKHRFLPKEHVTGRLVFMTGVYDTLDIFAYELMKEFRQLGYEVMEFHSSDMQRSLALLSDYIKEPVTAVITFNNLGFNMELVEGKNIWDELGIWCINILMDHPFCHKAALDHAPAHAIVLCPDKNHMNYVQRFYPQIPITGFLPHAGKEKAQQLKPIAERCVDVIYAGGLSRKFAYEMMPDFSQFSFDAKQIADQALADVIAHPDKTSEQAIEEALLAAQIVLSDDELCDFIEKIHYIDLLAVSHYREATVRALVEAGIDVTLYGTGWEDCDWLNAPNLHFMGRISADAVIDCMMDAKIVLNTMTWFKDGTHDRVFNGMLSGAVAVSDSSIYMKEEFCGDIADDKAELLLFELEEIDQLPLKVKELLADAKRMQQIADLGRQKALAHHTWKARALELQEDLLSQLSCAGY